MNSMFLRSKFTGDLSEWGVSRVMDMRTMFDKSLLEGREPDWYED